MSEADGCRKLFYIFGVERTVIRTFTVIHINKTTIHASKCTGKSCNMQKTYVYVGK